MDETVQPGENGPTEVGAAAESHGRAPHNGWMAVDNPWSSAGAALETPGGHTFSNVPGWLTSTNGHPTTNRFPATTGSSPASGSAAPANGSTAPTNGSAAPASGSAAPANGSAWPDTRHRQADVIAPAAPSPASPRAGADRTVRDASPPAAGHTSGSLIPASAPHYPFEPAQRPAQAARHARPDTPPPGAVPAYPSDESVYAPPSAYARQGYDSGPRVLEALPQRVPVKPDVSLVAEPPSVDSPAEAPELARIATHLRRDDVVPPQERPDGFDVNAILAAVREVDGVHDATLRTTETGAHSLRLDLRDGVDAADISRLVARLLQDRMGLAAAVPGEEEYTTPFGGVPSASGFASVPYIPAQVTPDSREPLAARRQGRGFEQGTATGRGSASERVPLGEPGRTASGWAAVPAPRLNPAPVPGRTPASPAAPVADGRVADGPVAGGRVLPGLWPYQTGGMPVYDPAAAAGQNGRHPRAPLQDEQAGWPWPGGNAPPADPTRPYPQEPSGARCGADPTDFGSAPGEGVRRLVAPRQRDPHAPRFGAPDVERPETEPARPLIPADRPGPRVVIDNVQVTTFGMEATVEVRLVVGDQFAAGVAAGPAVDGYLLRLCAMATASAVDELLALADRTDGPARCYVEHAASVPFATSHVAVVVLLLSCGGWVEQLAGSAVVAGDERQAMVRATLAAMNRRLEALLF